MNITAPQDDRTTVGRPDPVGGKQATKPDRKSHGWSIVSELDKMVSRHLVSDEPLDESTIPEWLKR